MKSGHPWVFGMTFPQVVHSLVLKSYIGTSFLFQLLRKNGTKTKFRHNDRAQVQANRAKLTAKALQYAPWNSTHIFSTLMERCSTRCLTL